MSAIEDFPRHDPSPWTPPFRQQILFYDWHDRMDSSYQGRALTRSKVLQMTPAASPSVPSTRKALKFRDPGLLWSLVAVDGLPLALRARDFPTRQAALRDIRRVLRRVSELEVTDVYDSANLRRGWWLSLDGEVMIVAGRPTKPSDSGRDARRVVAALGRLAGKR